MSGRQADHGECAERDDDLAAYALGALSAAEASTLEHHLSDCERCKERLQWLHPATDLLPASVAQLRPAPELKQNLMAVVRAEAAAAAGEPESKQATTTPGLFAGLRRRLLGDGPLRPALAGFAAFCLVVVGIAGYQLGSGGDQQATTSSFAALPTSPKTDAHGTVEVGDGSATLTVSGMKTIPRDEVYQAWIADGDVVQPSSIFVVDADGRGSASIPDMPPGADRLMVTREPAGGSQKPSTAPMLSAEL